MLRFVASIAILGALSVSAPVAASAPAANASSASSEPATKAAAKERRICKRQELEMGSRMAGKVCKTESEWKAEADAGRERVKEGDKN